MSTNIQKQQIEEIFNRGIAAEVLPSKEEFLKVFMSGKRLKIYLGADPTSDSLHLSHAKNYMFLEELRQFGHEVIILIGDFTAQIGDPTNRSETRKQLTEQEIKKNVKNWISQIRPLMDFDDIRNPPKIIYNSQWLSKLSFKDVVSLASNFTVQQMLERDMFKRRFYGSLTTNTSSLTADAKKKPIFLHEFLYPIMQGYDSVALDVDAELCGTDQIFNALAGRTLLKRIKNKNKFVIAVNLMENPKTKTLMSKSNKTGVFLSLPPYEMYGALMAQPDEMTEVFFINCTRIPLSQRDEIFSRGPKNAKAKIAFEIVKKIYGEESAKNAQGEFNNVFSQRKIPSDISVVLAQKNESTIDFLVRTKLAASRSAAKRLIEGGAVELDGKKIPRPDIVVKNGTLRVGKTKFVRVSIS